MNGSIKKDGSTWYYIIDLGKKSDGKRQQKKKRGFKTKKEAQQALTVALNELMNGTYVAPSKMLYKDFLMEWLETKKNSIKQQTLNGYTVMAETHIIPTLGNANLQELNPMLLQRFANDLCDKGLAGAYIKKILNVVNGSLNSAKKLGLISSNPTELVEKPRVTKKEMQVWNEQEIDRFLTVVENDRLFIAFFLAITTGLRQGEILGLRWKDIDFDSKSLSVRQTLSHDGKEFLSGAKTKSSLRVVHLSDETVKALKKHRNLILQEKLKAGGEYNDNDLVVRTPSGTPVHPRNLLRKLKSLQKKAGVTEIRFHDLRHTHATLLLKQGIHAKVVAERLGHSDTRMTLDTYSHVLPTMQAQAATAIDELLFSKASR